MDDRPIIFSAPMVRALLGGRKSQTRRVLKPQPEMGDYACNELIDARDIAENRGLSLVEDQDGFFYFFKRLPYTPGDRLYVREAWRTSAVYDDLKPSELGGDESVRYEVDGKWESWGWGDIGCVENGRYRHARFMPRWASRLTLTVTDVRVRRVQEISRGDAMEEGCPFSNMAKGPDPREWFRDLWNSLHGPDAWARNDWVAALTFTVQSGHMGQDAKNACIELHAFMEPARRAW